MNPEPLNSEPVNGYKCSLEKKRCGVKGEEAGGDFENMSGNGFSAVRTKTISRLNGHSTKSALKVWPLRDIERFTGCRGKIAAALAFKERNPLFDPEKG